MRVTYKLVQLGTVLRQFSFRKQTTPAAVDMIKKLIDVAEPYNRKRGVSELSNRGVDCPELEAQIPNRLYADQNIINE